MHKKTKKLPLPGGKGGGGISFPFGEGGHKSKLKAGVAGGKESKLPAGCRQRPPSRQGRGKPPRRHHSGRVCKCRKRSNPGDARGEAPCMK